LTGNGIAISPDGRSVVVTGSTNGRSMLYRRAIDQLEAVPIRGTEDGQFPFFDPSGEWLAFFSDNALKKVPADGGPASTITPSGSRFGASWGPNQTIVFASSASPDLMQVSASGGTPTVLVAAKAFPGASLRWPTWSSDGRTVFFSVFGGSLGSIRVAAYSLETGKTQVVTEGTQPIALGRDTLVFARGGSLWRATIDSDSLTIGDNPPVPIVEGVQINTGGLAIAAALADGTVAFRPGSAGEELTLVWAARDGTQQPLIVKPETYRTPRIAPDGSRIALVIVSSGAGAAEAESDVWVYDSRTQAMSRVTFGAGRRTDPVWTPDGKRLIYASSEGSSDNVRNLYWSLADGTGGPERLTTHISDQIPRTISHDGRTLIYMQRALAGAWDLGVLTLDAARKTSGFVNTDASEFSPAFSHDSRFVAYVSNETGRNEVYVRAFPGPVGKWQVSGSGGGDPVWSPDGKELYYWAVDNGSVTAVPVDISGATFNRGTPRTLFPYARPVAFPLTLTPDGERFALLQRPTGDETPRVVVTLNAFGSN
jgi:serine/threonine-protein kinase